MTVKGACTLLNLVMWTASLLGSAPQDTAEHVSIKGVIVDPAGAPIEGATVKLVRSNAVLESTTSQRSGNFILRTANFDHGELQVSARGFHTETVKLTGTVGEVDVGKLRLKIDCSSPDALCDDFGLGAK
jgi:hypothetical protein